ncbi:pheromone B alpha 1 receptor [Mycena olivaceomarginata]|nr:pheromone B alpha 1 receptor [Mycena olivaceomarginata]
MSYFYTGAPNWVFSMFAFIGVLCSSIPLPWHLEAWNTGTCLYMIWSALACLVFFVNSIVWNGTVLDLSPTWCDISTHFLNGFNLAIPACSLCINRRLYQIASVRSVTKTRAEKHRAIMIDLAIGLGLPLLQIPLQYIVQGHRYNIFEDVGCIGETFETPVAIVLFHLPPLLVGCVSAVYCVLSIRAFYATRAQFKELLSSSNNLNLNRYVRLMLLAGTDIAMTIPLSIWVLWVNARIVGISPWISWADTHSNFSRVVQVPGVIWRSDPYTVASLETTRWVTVVCSLLFFAYFGFADEAMKNYRGAWWSVAKRVGYSGATSSATGLSSSNGGSSKYPQMSVRGTLPVFIRKDTSQKRDSFDSFTSSDINSSISPVDSMGGVLDSMGALEYDKEKSFGAMSFGDVSGMLPDYKESDYSSAPSSGASASSASRPHTPAPAPSSGVEDDIEVSSLHRASVHVSEPAPAFLHPRHAPDVPMPVHDAADIV